MSDKPEALRLADALADRRDWYEFDPAAWCPEAAAELRRLHAENEALKAELTEQARLNGMGSEREARLLALNTELVEALNSLLNDVGRANSMLGAVKARAALAKSTTQGESK